MLLKHGEVVINVNLNMVCMAGAVVGQPAPWLVQASLTECKEVYVRESVPV